MTLLTANHEENRNKPALGESITEATVAVFIKRRAY